LKIIVFHRFYKQHMLNSLFSLVLYAKQPLNFCLGHLIFPLTVILTCEGTHEAGEQASNQTSRHACNQAGKPASELACIQTGKHTHEATEQAERKQTSRHAIKQAGKPASKQERLEWARGARPPPRAPLPSVTNIHALVRMIACSRCLADLTVEIQIPLAFPYSKLMLGR